MFHPFFFRPGVRSRHCHDVLGDAMVLAAVLKVEQDLQDKRSEEREREIQAELSRKCGVFLDRVETRAQQYHVVLVEVGMMFLKAFCFGRASGRTRLGKKPEQYLVPAQIGERH